MERREGNPRSEAGHQGSLAEWHELSGNREKALELYREAVSVMERHELSQAFGGKRMEDFRRKIEELDVARHRITIEFPAATAWDSGARYASIHVLRA